MTFCYDIKGVKSEYMVKIDKKIFNLYSTDI